jgi:hypothetical protein
VSGVGVAVGVGVGVEVGVGVTVGVGVGVGLEVGVGVGVTTLVRVTGLAYALTVFRVLPVIALVLGARIRHDTVPAVVGALVVNL